MLVGCQSHVVSILIFAWGVVKGLWFWVVAGAAIAALAGTLLPAHKPVLVGKSKRLPAILGASLAGMISPACTYGTVPICIELVQRGTPIGPIIAFLASSSIITPQIWLMTLGALGPYIAGTQIGAAFVVAVLAGLLFQRLQDRGVRLLTPDAESKLEETSDLHGTRHEHEHHSMRPWHARFFTRFLDLLEFVALYFVLGALLAGVVEHFVSPSLVAGAMGKGKWYAIPVATVTSVPVYVCGGASVILLRQGAAMGMAQGAVLAFVVAGPATRFTSLAALASVMRKRAVLGYVLLVVIVATVAGYAFAAWNPAFVSPKAGGALTP